MAMSEPPSKVRWSLQSTIQSFFTAHGTPMSSSSVPDLTAPATTPEQVHLPNVDFDEDTNPGQLPLAANANDIWHAVNWPFIDRRGSCAIRYAMDPDSGLRLSNFCAHQVRCPTHSSASSSPSHRLSLACCEWSRQ